MAIAIEDKSVRSLSRSARGIRQAPGTGVSAKSGLNRVLRDAALSERMKVVTSETKKQGIRIYAVWPQGSSQTCAACGYRHRDNRKSQAEFRCLACGHEANADTNAALIGRSNRVAGKAIRVRTRSSGRRRVQADRWQQAAQSCWTRGNSFGVRHPRPVRNARPRRSKTT